MRKIILLSLILGLLGCSSKEVKEYNAAVKARVSHGKLMDSYNISLKTREQSCYRSLIQDRHIHSLNPNEPLITIATQKTCEDVEVLRKLVNEEKDKHGKLLEKENALRKKAGL